jgi:hypothetical protein
VADWPVDLTTDPWFNMDYPITDGDPGQPLELFGVGFGPHYTFLNWTETSAYVGGDHKFYGQRAPFPFVYQDGTDERLHVEDSVKQRFTPTPWAIGVPVGYTRGRQMSPFPVHFDLMLSLSGARVREYFQEQLSAGRVFVAITSLTVTSKQAPSGFPSFFTKEGAALDPNARPPRLAVTLAASGDPDGDADRDWIDWKELADCMGGPESTPGDGVTLSGAGCLCVFDYDDDLDVDLRDAAYFIASFGP